MSHDLNIIMDPEDSMHTNVIPHIPDFWAPEQPNYEEKAAGNTIKHQQYASFFRSARRIYLGSSQINQCWCANGGSCEYHNHIYGHHHPHKEVASCKCRKGYVGKHCEQALCRPGCANGGLCVDPDVCSCPDGFTGARCQTGNDPLVL